MQSLGKSGLLMKIEVAKNILIIISVLASFPFGIHAMVAGFSFVNVLVSVSGYCIAGKHISYKLSESLSDIFPYLLISAVVFIPLYFFSWAVSNVYVLVIIQGGAGMALYLLIVKMLGSKVLDDCISFFREKGISKLTAKK